VDLEEVDTAGSRENIVGMFGLETNPDRKPGERGWICSHDPSPSLGADGSRRRPASARPADYAGRL